MNKGISMIEMLVVVAIVAVTLTTLLGVATFSLKASGSLRGTTQANFLAQEVIEAVRNFRDGTDWATAGLGSLTIGSTYHPEKTTAIPKKWTMVSGEETIGIFKRKVVFERVWRDLNDNIADSGTQDLNTRKVTATVSWKYKGEDKNVELVTYLTNWKQ